MSRWRTTSREPEAPPATVASGDGARLGVRKTYKLYVGGNFVRSESARSLPVALAGGGRRWVPAASRKDVRDAVAAARRAWPAWAARSAFNRGQILYRVAEVAEDRRATLAAELREQGAADPAREVDVAIDRCVHYAGWADKLSQIAGTVNAVAGDYFSFTMPEPTGVVGLAAPARPGLAGLLSRLAPALAGGNTVVAIASESQPLSALTFAEVLASADVPPGVVNILCGRTEELLAPLAGHMDVNALDLGDLPGDLAADAERAAAANLKRVVRRPGVDWLSPAAQGLEEVVAFTEAKTVWHSMGY